MGIDFVEQVPIPPDELIPADAQVEMDAKKAAGYFTVDQAGHRGRSGEGRRGGG